MGPYREIRTIAFLEKEYPHVIEVPIPPKGLGRKLDQIEAWLSQRIERREYGRWGRFRNGMDIAIWAFRTPEAASNFRKFDVNKHRQFGGAAIDRCKMSCGVEPL